MNALPALGRFEGLEHCFALRVYFEDTDLTGVVYHANYLRYFERARSDMLRSADIDQRAVLEAGEGVYVVAEAQLKYHRPATLEGGDVLALEPGAVLVGMGERTTPTAVELLARRLFSDAVASSVEV